MTLDSTAIILSLCLFGVLIALRLPLFLCVSALAGLACLTWSSLAEPLTAIPLAITGILEERSLLAIPLFLFTSVILSSGDGGNQLVGLIIRLTARLPGRALTGTVLSAVAFSALSGSSPATVMALTTALMPTLLAAGYNKTKVIGSITASSALGTLVPPSVAVILYAIVAQSALQVLGPAGGAPMEPLTPDLLYKTALIPTLLTALFMVVMIAVLKWDKGVKEAKVEDGFVPWKAAMVMVIPIVVLGGLYGGFLNLLQAATMSMALAAVLELFAFRKLKIKDLGDVFVEGAMQVGVLLIVIALTLALNNYLTLQNVPTTVTEWLASRITEPWQFLLMVNLLLLVAGCLMDIFSATLLLGPLMVPLAMRFGLDPVWFGVLFLFNLELGFLTPPVGINLFAAAGMLRMSVMEVAKAALPLLIWLFLALFALSVWLLTGGMPAKP